MSMAVSIPEMRALPIGGEYPLEESAVLMSVALPIRTPARRPGHYGWILLNYLETKFIGIPLL